jgi:hypothetical protein
MGTLKIQLSLYPYLVSICFIEFNVLRIPKLQIYYAINGDTFCLLFKKSVFNLLEVNSYKFNREHQRYSIIIPSISMLVYCIYMHDTR